MPVRPIDTSLPPELRPVQLASDELGRWQSIASDSSEARLLIDEYWSSMGHKESDPWSAAFIQWLLRLANPNSAVKATSHVALFRAALGDQRLGRYQTLPPTTPIEVGDVVLRNRGGGSFTWEDLQRMNYFPSHSDIVVSIEGDEAIAIGGNKVGRRVGIESYPIEGGGIVPGLIAVLRLNRAAPLPDDDSSLATS